MIELTWRVLQRRGCVLQKEYSWVWVGFLNSSYHNRISVKTKVVKYRAHGLKLLYLKTT